jgi:hypothetical protein
MNILSPMQTVIVENLITNLLGLKTLNRSSNLTLLRPWELITDDARQDILNCKKRKIKILILFFEKFHSPPPQRNTKNETQKYILMNLSLFSCNQDFLAPRNALICKPHKPSCDGIFSTFPSTSPRNANCN